MKRFWDKVDKPTPLGCWVWTGCRHEFGYGRFGLNGETVYAHRLAYELTNGSIPKGQYVRHMCDTPACCNPAHLVLGTQAENLKDMQNRGRDRYKGEQNGQSKMTDTGVKALRQRRSEGTTYRQLGKEFGISYSQAHAICNDNQWRHLK